LCVRGRSDIALSSFSGVILGVYVICTCVL
jgi:hypothetical protein